MNIHSKLGRRFALVAGASTVAAMTLLGCSSTSDSSAGGDGDTVVIGVASPQSGEAAEFGVPVDKATRAVVNEMNALGGIGGKTLEVVTEDENFNAEDGVRVVSKLINNDNAQFILGPTSATFMAVLDTAERNQVMIASPYAGMVEFDEASNPYVFRTMGPDTFEGLAAAKNMIDQGYMKLAIMNENNDSAQSAASWVSEFYTKLGGEVVDEITFNSGQSSYLAEVQGALANDPEIIYVAGTGESAIPIVREWARMGVPTQWSVSAEVINTDLIPQVGPEYVEGFYGSQAIGAEDSPAFEAMTELLVAEYGEEEGNKLARNQSSALSYDAAVVALLAMVAGGDATGTAVSENLHAVSDPGGTPVFSLAEGVKALENGETIDYQGASGPVDFNETNSAAPDFAAWQITDGEWEAVRVYTGTELFDLIDQLEN